MIIQWILNYVRRFQLCSWLILGRWIILSLDCTVRPLRGVKAKTQKNFKRAMLFHWVCMTGTELAYLQITKLANFLILLTLVYLQREYKIRNIKSWKAPGAWSQEEELTKPCEVRIQWGGVCVPFWSLSSSFVAGRCWSTFLCDVHFLEMGLPEDTEVALGIPEPSFWNHIQSTRLKNISSGSIFPYCPFLREELVRTLPEWIVLALCCLLSRLKMFSPLGSSHMKLFM